MKKKLLTDFHQKWFLLLAFTLLFISYSYAQTNHAPVVSNIHVQQRPGTRLIDITYDVEDADGDLLEITVTVSTDNGKTYNIIPKFLTGDVGKNIKPGKGKKIVWDAKKDMATAKGSTFKIRITADDGIKTPQIPDSLTVSIISKYDKWHKGIIKIDANASSANSTISFVQFGYSFDKANWMQIGQSVKTAPYTIEWDTTSIKQAPVVWLRAKATDSNGKSATYVYPTSIGIDNYPPTTSNDYDNLWHKEDFVISLTAYDGNGIGVSPSNIRYKLNNGEEKNVLSDGQPMITTEGISQLEYWSIDDIGNTEAHHTIQSIKLDKTPPILAEWIKSPMVLAKDSIGPLRISVRVSDGSGSGLLDKIPQFSYHIGEGMGYSEYAGMMSGEANTWYYDIPEPQGGWSAFAGKNVYYKTKAEDAAGNVAESPDQIELIISLPRSIVDKDGVQMVLIPEGEFQMGSNDGISDEKPVHTVYLDDFYIDKYEVTNAQYKKFVQATGHREPEGLNFVNGAWQNGFKPWTNPNFNRDDQPVVCVNWEDAKAYADWAGKRLPTEAEWEKSARGGLVDKKYVWGDEWPPPKNAGNFADISVKSGVTGFGIIDGYDDSYAYLAPVGSFKPNGYGLYDMAGNVWEWCADWYDSGYYTKSPKSNPTGPSSGSYRVRRGGSWGNDNTKHFRVSIRSFNDLFFTDFGIGFRCAGLSVTP